MSAPAEAPPDRVAGSGPSRLAGWAAPLAVPGLTVLLCVVFGVLRSQFLTAQNWLDILSNSALPAIVAVGLTVCLAMNEFDLSIAAVAGFCTMFVSVLLVPERYVLASAVAMTLAAAVAAGLFNGLAVAYGRVNALIVTIGVGSVLNGLEFYVSRSQQIYGGYPDSFVAFCRGKVGPVSTLVVVALAVAVAAWLLLEHTTTGREMRAIGGNPTAARMAGVHVRRITLVGFVVCSALAGLAGILYAGRQAVAYPLTGLNVLLPSYAAAFIGAASVRVGQFNVWGTLLGVLITTISANGLLLLNVPAYATYVLQGAILLLALLIARVIGRRDAAGAG